MFQLAHVSDAEWDAALDRVVMWTGVDHSVGVWGPYNYSGWARMKELDGWSFLRVTDDSGAPVAQVLVKRKGPVVIAYAPGGFVCARPVGAREYVAFLRRETGASFVYARTHMITPTKFYDPDLRGNGWTPVSKRLSASATLKLRLNPTMEERESFLSYNWKRNLKRSAKNENVVTIEQNPSIEDILALNLEFESFKGDHLNPWERSRTHIERMIATFGPRLVVAKCVSEEGELRAIRGALITSGCAYDFLAATSLEGRKHYASHGTLWALANELARRGVVRYDLGGIDPVNNRGVYDFKNGTGAVEVTYGEEYDVTSPSICRRIASTLATRFR